MPLVHAQWQNIDIIIDFVIIVLQKKTSPNKIRNIIAKYISYESNKAYGNQLSKELYKKYFAIAERRINQATRDLF